MSENNSKTKAINKGNIVPHIIAFAVSVILFISLFIPLVKMNTELLDEEISVGISPKDNIELFANSIFLSNKDIEETKVYEEWEPLYEYIKDREDRRVDEEKLTEFAMASLKVEALNNSDWISVSSILSVILSIAYAVLVIILLIRNTVQLISALVRIKKGADAPGWKSRRLTVVVCGILSMLVLSLLWCYNLRKDMNYSHYAKNGTSVAFMTYIVAALLIFSILFTTIFERKKVLQTATERTHRERIRLFIALAVSAVVIISVFLPALSVNLYSAKGRSVDGITLHVRTSDMHEYSGNDLQLYTQNSPYENYEMLLESVPIAIEEDGEGYTGEDYLGVVIFGVANTDLSVLYIISALIDILLVFIVAFIAVQIIKGLSYGKYKVRNMRKLRRFGFLISLVRLAFSVTFYIFSEIVLLVNKIETVSFSVGMGPFIGMLGFILLYILLNQKDTPYTDQDYDNADISFAPYVI